MTVSQDLPSSNLVKADPSTIFVLGNGPSLAGVDFHKFSAHPTIGLNAAYRHWRRIDWRPSFYACLDLVVGLSHRDEIAELIRENRIKRFLLRGNLIEALGDVARCSSVVDFEALRTRNALLGPPAITTGSHSALWAAAMGYQKIVILGVDGRYKEIVSGAELQSGGTLEIVKSDKNPNYFFEDYQRPGDKYNIPNPRPDLHVNAWRSAARTLAAAGVETYNGNSQSAVRVFPFVDVQEVLGEGGLPTPADERLEEPPVVPLAFDEGCRSASSRAAEFARRHKRLLGGVAAASGAIFALALAGDVAEMKLVGGLFAVAIGGLVVAMTYARYVLTRHVSRLQDEVDALKAQLRDLDRRV